MFQPRIMIVDDSPFSVAVTKEAFNDKGFDVVATAINKEEMISQFNETSPNIVTMDMTMPEIDGFESIIELKQFNPNVQFIIISALKDDDLVKKANELGVSCYLQKPLDQEELLTAVKKITQEAEIFQELQSQYFEFFKEAFSDTMNKMTRTTVKFVDEKKDNMIYPSKGFVTVIGIIGDYPGRMLLDMSNDTATGLAEKVYGQSTDIEKTLNMLTEFANIVAGSACSMLNKKNRAYGLRLSPPTVFYGDTMHVSRATIDSTTGTVETDFGEIILNVGFSRGESAWM